MPIFTLLWNFDIKALFNIVAYTIIALLINLNCTNAEVSTNRFKQVPNSEIPEKWNFPGLKDPSSNKHNIGFFIRSDSESFLKHAFSILYTVEIVNNIDFFETTSDYIPLLYFAIDDIIVENKINYDLLNLTDESEKELISQIVTKSNECYVMFNENLSGHTSIVVFDNTTINSENESLKCFLYSIYGIFYGPNFDNFTPPNEIGEFLIYTLDLIRKFSEKSE